MQLVELKIKIIIGNNNQKLNYKLKSNKTKNSQLTLTKNVLQKTTKHVKNSFALTELHRTCEIHAIPIGLARNRQRRKKCPRADVVHGHNNTELNLRSILF